MSSNNKLDLDGLEYLWSKITGYIQEQIEYGSEVWIKIGKTTMGTVASTVTGAIKEIVDKLGNTTMGTTATTITGAIAEHESDITDLNSNLNKLFTPTTNLTSSDNMNSVDVGVYYQSGLNVPANAPDNSYNAYIVCVKARNEDRLQLWFSTNAQNIKFRTTQSWSNGASSDWTVWKTISTT